MPGILSCGAGESEFAVDKPFRICYNAIVAWKHAAMAQSVERVLGKDEVPGPNPGSSSREETEIQFPFCFIGLSLYHSSMLPDVARGQCSVTPAGRAPTSVLAHKIAYVHALREHEGEHRTIRVPKCRCSPWAHIHWSESG